MRSLTTERAVLWVGLAGGALAALYFGLALDWDLLNYHLYNPHALVHGRLSLDLAPAQMQSFHNPLLQLPYYLLFRYLHPSAAVAAFGALQGAQLWLLYRVARALAGTETLPNPVLIALAFLGLLGPIFLNQLGGPQGDTALSMPVLGALLLLLGEQRRADPAAAFRTGLLAGVLLGTATALKLTMAIYGLALPAAALLLAGGPRRWRLLAGLALGGLAGVAVFGGAWFSWLWLNWDNPLFPYFNDLFHSGWIYEQNHMDPRFIPKTAQEWWLYPLYWAVDPLRVWEFPFRDFRLPLLFLLAPFVPWLYYRSRRHRASGLLLVWLFVSLSYLLWLGGFSIYRYLSVIEMLAPMLLMITAVRLFRHRRTWLVTLGLLLVTQSLVQFHRQEGEGAFRADAPTVLERLPQDSMVVIDSMAPVAYAALWLDDSIPLVRLRSNLIPGHEPNNRLQAEAWKRAADHRGPLYLLLPWAERDEPSLADDLAHLGRRLDRGACVEVFDEAGLQQRLNLEICRLETFRGVRANGSRRGRRSYK